MTKKLLLLLMFMLGTFAAHADDYSYLTFETTDGSKTSVSVSSLTITISGTTLTAGGQSFTLSNLSKMYFSTSDQTTGINDIFSSDTDQITDIYDLQGRKVSKDQMRSGVYVIKTAQGTRKVNVK